MNNVFEEIFGSLRNAYNRGVLGWLLLFSIPIVVCCIFYALGILAERLAEQMSEFIVMKAKGNDNDKGRNSSTEG